MNATDSSVIAAPLFNGAAYARVKQVSQHLSLSKSMIHGLIDQGELETVRVGTAVLIPVESIAKLEERLKATGSI